MTEKKDHPLTFWCEDFDVGKCCEGYCHGAADFTAMRRRMIAVYPESVFSVPFQDKMPDFSLGLHAEVCCGRYEAVRQLPRSWWVRRYGEKKGYKEEHIQLLIDAPADKYHRVCGELASLYHDGRPASGVSVSIDSRRISAPQQRAVRVSAPKSRTCSGCGEELSKGAVVCDNCGTEN